MTARTSMVVAYNGADAGLGNRLRVTLGAARLARHRHARFGYVWPSTPMFQPLLAELWEWREGMRIPRFLSRSAGLLTGYTGHDVRDAPMRRVLQIRTGAELVLPPEAGDWREDLRALVPVQEVAEIVTAIHRRELSGVPYVGVQIRAHRVSHQETKDSSPVEWFAARMRELVDERPDTRFYVSCDVPEVKRRMLHEFPGAVAHLSDAPYNSTAAVRAAIVDLYLLASSSYMLGPHHSSFIEIAQFLSGMSVPTDKPTESRSRSVDWWRMPPVIDPLTPHARGERPPLRS